MTAPERNFDTVMRRSTLLSLVQALMGTRLQRKLKKKQKKYFQIKTQIKRKTKMELNSTFKLMIFSL